MPIKSYKGHLLAANPSNPRDPLHGSVIIMVAHTPIITFGIQINQPSKDFNLSSLCSGIGLWYDGEDTGYYGGNMKTEKVHVVHTKDWMGMTSQDITDDLAVTSDISVLTALCAGEGPSSFRACAGFWAWEQGTLERQMDTKNNSAVHRWEAVPATTQLVFDKSGTDQWHEVLSASGQFQISNWL